MELVLKIMGCFAPVLGRLHRALNYYFCLRLCHVDETYKAETAFHGCHYILGNVVVRMPDRGLLFECVTCFIAGKGFDCVKFVPIPVKKNRMAHPYR